MPDVCPHCGNPGAEQKTTKARGTWNKCLKCQTEFAPVEPEPAAASAEVAAGSLN